MILENMANIGKPWHGSTSVYLVHRLRGFRVHERSPKVTLLIFEIDYLGDKKMRVEIWKPGA